MREITRWDTIREYAGIAAMLVLWVIFWALVTAPLWGSILAAVLIERAG